MKISDNLSGIDNYRGEIDGKFALFELDGKTGRLNFRMDASRWTRGTKHDLVISVTDGQRLFRQINGCYCVRRDRLRLKFRADP